MAGVIKAAGARGRRPKALAAGARTGPGDAMGAAAADGGFLSRVIEMLSHHERMALRMRHGQGMAPAAIAARMNLPESIVNDLLARAEATVRAAQRAFLDALAEAASPNAQ